MAEISGSCPRAFPLVASCQMGLDYVHVMRSALSEQCQLENRHGFVRLLTDEVGHKGPNLHSGNVHELSCFLYYLINRVHWKGDFAWQEKM